MLTLSACTVDLDRGRVHHPDGERALTTREAELLRYLAERPGRTVSRDELLRDVFGYADDVVSRAVDSAVRRLREKVEADPARPDHLLTAFGEGYRFVPLPEPPVATPLAAPSPARVDGRVLDLGDVRIDLDRARIFGPRGDSELTANELALIEILAERGAADREALAHKVWGAGGARALVNAVMRLRRKLEPDPAEPRLLVTTTTGYELRRPVLEPARAPEEPLIGRAALVAQVRKAIAPGRWVVLVGLGGVGKSRLAREIGGGAWVDASGVADAGELAGRVARAWGIPPASDDDPVARLERVLAGKQGLLVLDDLDRLDREGRAALARWVGAAPRLAWLGTCRARTGLPGEALVEVPPLSADDGERLFVARAHAADPAFRLFPADRGAVRELVARVDGVPLAIGLLAARAQVFAPDALLAELADPARARELVADPLESGRHASMAAVIESSVAELAGEDRDALYALSLFRSFDAADAAAMLGAGAADRVARLRARHLLRRVEGVERRFAVWGVVRDHAADRIAPDVARRWLAHLARFGAEERRVALEARDLDLDAQIEASLDDLPRAVALARSLGESELAARCAIGLAHHHGTAGPVMRAVAIVDDAVLDPALPPTLRARLGVLRAQALLKAYRFADADAAAVALLAGPRDERTELWAFGVRALVGQVVGADDGRQRFVAMAAAAERAGEAAWARYAAWGVAQAAGDGERVRAELEGVIAAADPDHPLALEAARLLGQWALVRHRLGEARFWLEEALAHRLARRDYGSWQNLQQWLLTLHVQTGEAAAADEVFAETLAAVDEVDHPLLVAIVRALHAASLLFRGAPEAAERRAHEARAALARQPEEGTRAYLDARTAEIAVARGDLAAAFAAADRSIAWYEANHRSNSPHQVRAIRAVALSEAGRHDEALAAGEGAWAGVADAARKARCVVGARYATVLARAGERERAAAIAQEVRQLVGEIGAAPPGSEVGWVVGGMERSVGRPAARSAG